MSGEEIIGTVYETGSVIFRQGEPGDTMYVIQSGAVEIFRIVDDREEVLSVLQKGDFFGEMSLLRDAPRGATARTLQQTRLLPLTKVSLLERGKRDPEVLFHLIKGLIVRLGKTREALRQSSEQAVRGASGQAEEPAAVGPAGRASLPVPGGETTGPAALPAPRAPSQSVADSTRLIAAALGIDAAGTPGVSPTLEGLQSFAAGTRVFQEGDPGDAMYIVMAGTVHIVQGQARDEQVVAVLAPGNFFGEMSLLSDGSRNAGAVAVTPASLLAIKKAEFQSMIRSQPELALFVIRTVLARLEQMEGVRYDPSRSVDAARGLWQPVLEKETIRVSLVALSTCAGCSAVLLDDEFLGKLNEHARIVYCPMLMDKDHIPEADVAIVDGLVRLREDAEVLGEVRAKSKVVVAWGTCACFGGIPAIANRHDLDDLIAETYGGTADAFGHYLSGKSGTTAEGTYQEHGIRLLRQASRLDVHEKVDYMVPGCPPAPLLLLQLVEEVTGVQVTKAKAVVCAECPRNKPNREPVACLHLHPPATGDPGKCLAALGVACMGSVTRGGCGAACPSSGQPCWSCRGPSVPVLKKILEGQPFEEAFGKILSQRCRFDEAKTREHVRLLRRQGHALYDFDHELPGNLARYR